jgi:hypothetical protein
VDTGDIAALQEGEQVRAQVSLIRAQALLTHVQAGYTRESAISAVEAGDVSLLVPDPQAIPAPHRGRPGDSGGEPVQHLLPQAQPGTTASPLPAGSTPRLPVGSVSPGDGGNGSRPTRRPAAVRRGLNGIHDGGPDSG